MELLKIERLLLFLICMLAMAMILWPVTIHLTTFDFHWDDTYYVIDLLSIIATTLLYCCLLFGMYVMIRKKYVSIHPIISWPHVFSTIGLVLFLIGGTLWFDKAQTARPRRYTDFSDADISTPLQYLSWYSTIFTILLWLFVITQFVFWFYGLKKLLFGNK